MKIKIFSFVFNRPDILQHQINSIKKFLIGDCEINVVYDTRDNEYYEQFKNICQNNDVNFYCHVSEPGQTPSFYNGQVISWIYENQILKDDDDYMVIFLDHDMFLISDFNPYLEVGEYDVFGLLQTRKNIQYVWPGLCGFKKSSVKNIEFDFYPKIVDGQSLDTGGGTYSLLSNQKIKFFDSGVEYPDEYCGLNLKDKSLTNGYNYELHFKGKFLHFRNACSWHNEYQVNDIEKTNLLFKILSDVIEDNDKKYFEIVVARYNENIEWTKNYLNYITLYNKGDDIIDNAIPLKNIGREPHTYLHHIINNYDNLANYTIFLQGNPFDHIYPHQDQQERLFNLLNDIIFNDKQIGDFYKILACVITGDYEYIREPYHMECPNIVDAYVKVFDRLPAEGETYTYASGAQFVVSKKAIHSRPIEFYKNILKIFEYDPSVDGYDEVNEKLLQVNERYFDGKNRYNPNNPQMAYHVERFWRLIFNEI
jgi:hypothetical protein